jgi:hypothetical protein
MLPIPHTSENRPASSGSSTGTHPVEAASVDEEGHVRGQALRGAGVALHLDAVGVDPDLAREERQVAESRALHFARRQAVDLAPAPRLRARERAAAGRRTPWRGLLGGGLHQGQLAGHAGEVAR